MVTLSSNAHKTVRGISFDNLNGDRRYFRWNAYGQSKLANLLFALELDRRLRAQGSTVKSSPPTPATRPQTSRAPPPARGPPGDEGRTPSSPRTTRWARCRSLRATEPGLEGGTYIGPDGIAEQRGHPKIVDRTAPRATRTRRRLWDVSADVTGVR